ncbi:hypothetical protein [Thiolapillus sp.]
MNDVAMNAGEVLWWRFGITWGLIIVGWIVINWQNNKRETRKERRILLDRLIMSLSELESNALQFHTADNHDPEILMNIIRRIKRIWPQIELLRMTKVPNIEHLSYNIRRTITLKNADASNFHKQGPNSKILLQISDAIDSMVNALETEFSFKYHYSFIDKKIFLRN